jgi:hypothetical protein|tara:strand:+ start:12349 stop:13011 length:663 start_codon:yes stop_codon:yes gene_type:complete
MSVKLSLPATFADLTLRHLQVLETSDDPMTCVGAVTGTDWEELREMPRALIQEAYNHLQTLRKAETQRHLETFELNGTRYGFIPNWDEFTAGEWIDAEQLCGDFWKNAHKVMALLFRPVKRELGKRYEIEPYTAKEDAEAFLDMPADQVAGALLFFSTTRNALLSTLQSSLIQAATKVATTSGRSGGGTLSSILSRVRTFFASKPSPNSPSVMYSPTSHS